MTSEEFEPIANEAARGWRVIAFAVSAVPGAVPMFRIICDDTSCKFRVEQLDGTQHKQGIYRWVVRSTHAGDEPFESYPPCINDMLQKQARFKEMVKLAAHEAKMARIQAMEPTT